MTSGAETQFPENQPESSPPDGMPDLTLDEWEEIWMGSEQDADKQSESVFSNRSGIRDLLVRPMIRPDSQGAGDEPDETEIQASGEQETGESESDQEVMEPVKRNRKGLSIVKPKRSRRQLDRARRRQSNYLEKRREQKRRMVFYNRIRLLFKLGFAILWGTLLWELLHSPFWDYNQPAFQLHNARLIQAEQLTPLVRDFIGKPIYAVNTGKLARKIKRHYPLVDEVSVRRKLFPSRLAITISEKQPWAEVYAGAALAANPDNKTTKPAAKGKKAAGDRQKQAAGSGKLSVRPYALAASEDFVSLAQYRYQPGSFGGPLEKLIVTPGSRHKLDYLNRVREIAWQARQIQGLHLASVDIRNPQLVALNFDETQVILGRLDGQAVERLARLIPLVPKIRELQAGINAVDLRWSEQVTFRTKPNVDLGLKPKQETDG